MIMKANKELNDSLILRKENDRDKIWEVRIVNEDNETLYA